MVDSMCFAMCFLIIKMSVSKSAPQPYSNYYKKQIPHYGIVAYDSYVDHHVENFAVEL